MLCETRQQLARVASQWWGALAPQRNYTAREWAESEDGPVLSAKTSSISGHINLDVTPYIRGPLDAFSDPAVKRIFLCFGTQSGKTTFLQCVIGYIIDQQPGPAMFLRPTEWEAMAFSKERMMPLIADTPSLSRHVLGRYDQAIKPLTYDFDRMTLSYAWSQSETSVRGRPIRYVIKDESSAYAPGASALADERCKTFWNAKIVETSTPKDATDTIWRALGLKKKAGTKPEDAYLTSSYEATSSTSVYFYHVQCPRCGGWIRLEMSQLRWPADMAIRNIEDHGWYECQLCGGKIRDAEKQFAVRNGEWRTDNPGGSWRGYHLNSLYAPWPSCRFGAVAAEYLRARSSGDFEIMQGFVNNWCALPYSLEDIGAETVSTVGIQSSKTAGKYLKNEIPEGVKALTMGVDVQKDCLYWVVAGWGCREIGGKTVLETWIISWGQAEKLDEIAELLGRTWTHPGGYSLRIVAAAIDGRYRTKEVKDFAKDFPGVVSVTFGEQSIKSGGRTVSSNSGVPYAASHIDRDSQGKAKPDSRTGYRLNTTYFKQLLYSRMNRTGDKPDAPVVHHLPDQDDADIRTYIRHCSSEMEVVERVKGSTATKRVWRVKRGYEANHLLDGTVYAYAIADIRGLFHLQPDSQPVGVVEPAGGKEKGQEGEGQKRRPRLFERRPLFGDYKP